MEFNLQHFIADVEYALAYDHDMPVDSSRKRKSPTSSSLHDAHTDKRIAHEFLNDLSNPILDSSEHSSPSRTGRDTRRHWERGITSQISDDRGDSTSSDEEDSYDDDTLASPSPSELGMCDTSTEKLNPFPWISE
jgi:hypothetical protein